MKVSVSQLKSLLSNEVRKQNEKEIQAASNEEVFRALSTIINRWIQEEREEIETFYKQTEPKQLYYLSMEFLIGRLLKMNLLNYDLLNITNQSLEELGFNPEDVYSVESDPGLGNGGLGRLAACFLDSLAALKLPGNGYGIRYKYGLFKQKILQGKQVELKDDWLRDPFIWETKGKEQLKVRFYGSVHLQEISGRLQAVYENEEIVTAVPYHILIKGFNNEVVNSLKLWSVEDGDVNNEEICNFLYPDDSTYEGKVLRLKQQYFLVSLSIQNIIKEHKKKELPIASLAEKCIIQINDTHPSLAIPEMMRILMDEEGMAWEDAWEITTEVFAYTNHTTLAEALEIWPADMLQTLLPRIYMIIAEINHRFCDEYTNENTINELAIITNRQVHMARLAIIGSNSINGVASLHTDILKTEVMKQFYSIFPEKFHNQTNGITHRRWLLQTNPRLANLITTTIGDDWLHHPRNLKQLLSYKDDEIFLWQLDVIKKQNKQELAHYIYQTTGMKIDDQSIFDVHIKRIHEYKRQLLKVFHILDLYHSLKENPHQPFTPKTFIFSGKAAASYKIAKDIILLIHRVATLINNDSIISEKLKVIFLENYSISLAEKLIPAVDISEQISTAGKEASGTGNMKMMMNGALTVGTLDGANVEMKELVGDENIFIFGLKVDEIQTLQGSYNVHSMIESDRRLKNIIELMRKLGCNELVDHLLYQNDEYFVLKDFADYVNINKEIEQTYEKKEEWLRKSIVNIGYSGYFSSDYTIRRYAEQIWRIKEIKSET